MTGGDGAGRASSELEDKSCQQPYEAASGADALLI